MEAMPSQALCSSHRSANSSAHTSDLIFHLQEHTANQGQANRHTFGNLTCRSNGIACEEASTRNDGAFYQRVVSLHETYSRIAHITLLPPLQLQNRGNAIRTGRNQRSFPDDRR